MSKDWENESEDAKMKETVKTSRTAGYLEKIFRALNAKYFNGELEEPIITIQSTPRAYGHVTVAKAWQRGDTTRHELNIGAGTLARPIENVVATTLHECVHLWNLQNGIQDCSRGGQYHNKKFKEAPRPATLKSAMTRVSDGASPSRLTHCASSFWNKGGKISI